MTEETRTTLDEALRIAGAKNYRQTIVSNRRAFVH